MTGRRVRFVGRIHGVGSASGARIVVGRWSDSPLGVFADVMVQRADGHRVLLAPTQQVRDFVTGTYTFDEVRLEPVRVEATDRRWQVRSPSLTLDATIGPRTMLGGLLRTMPRRVATSTVTATLADPVARVLLRGVRTRGSAGGGRREWYAASDVHAVTSIQGRYDRQSIGALAPVDPPARFGFSSTPRRPGVTSVVTTIELPG